jgi:hypothetical protein
MQTPVTRARRPWERPGWPDATSQLHAEHQRARLRSCDGTQSKHESCPEPVTERGEAALFQF